MSRKVKVIIIVSILLLIIGLSIYFYRRNKSKADAKSKEGPVIVKPRVNPAASEGKTATPVNKNDISPPKASPL